MSVGKYVGQGYGCGKSLGYMFSTFLIKGRAKYLELTKQIIHQDVSF